VIEASPAALPAGRADTVRPQGRNGSPPYTGLVDSMPISRADFGGDVSWMPKLPRFLDVKLIDGLGASSSASVFLERASLTRDGALAPRRGQRWRSRRPDRRR
jgi:hypothetical protein